jgi:hypothetical protein
MRLSTKALAVLAGTMLIATTAHAQLGGTGASLNIEPGARQNGMGGAGVALLGDATGATWWNPAALGLAKRPAIQYTYSQLVPDLADDVSYNYASYIHPVEGWGAFGLGIIFLDYGQSEGFDPGGNPTGSFGSNEFSPALYYGTELLPGFAVGASVKYIRIQLAPDSQSGVGSTFGIDLAGLYRIEAARLNLGVNVQNLGPSVTFINEDEASPLSRNIKSGFAWEAFNANPFSVTLAGDFNQSLVDDELRTYHGGAEFAYASQGEGLSQFGIAGRIGYLSDPVGDRENITWGLGLSWAKLGLDLGSIPQAEGLDYVQKITLGYRF